MKYSVGDIIVTKEDGNPVAEIVDIDSGFYSICYLCGTNREDNIVGSWWIKCFPVTI